MKEKEKKIAGAAKMCRDMLETIEPAKVFTAMLTGVKEEAGEGITWENPECTSHTTYEENKERQDVVYAMDGTLGETELSVLLSMSSTDSGSFFFHASLTIVDEKESTSKARKGEYDEVKEVYEKELSVMWTYDEEGDHPDCSPVDEVLRPTYILAWVDRAKKEILSALEQFEGTKKIPVSTARYVTHHFNLLLR